MINSLVFLLGDEPGRTVFLSFGTQIDSHKNTIVAQTWLWKYKKIRHKLDMARRKLDKDGRKLDTARCKLDAN